MKFTNCCLAKKNFASFPDLRPGDGGLQEGLHGRVSRRQILNYCNVIFQNFHEVSPVKYIFKFAENMKYDLENLENNIALTKPKAENHTSDQSKMTHDQGKEEPRWHS